MSGHRIKSVKRGFSIALLAGVLAVLVPATASAAPKGFVATWSCSDGHSYELNFGAPTNNGSTLFVDGSNTMFIVRAVAVYEAGELVVSFDRGMAGFVGKPLVMCSTTIDPDTFMVTGYFTPRNR